MKLPTVHINGTSREALLNANTKALSAVVKARVALEDAAPNGRDFYPQGALVIDEAVKEHNLRWGYLAAIESELREICEHLQTTSVRGVR